LISFDRNRSRNLRELSGQPEDLPRVVLLAGGKALCEQDRLIQRSHQLPARTIYHWRHYLAVIQRKPGALRHNGPLLSRMAAVIGPDV